MLRYTRLPRRMEVIFSITRADGVYYGKLMMNLAHTDLIFMDDWGLATIGTSQLPVESWQSANQLDHKDLRLLRTH